jgi:NodT family efflux transporter outer membrane factor (OMF) lipoprotein
VEVPGAYKELEGWKIAEPKDAVSKGKWWEIFKDPVLNGLMEQVDVSNQELRAAEARYAAARAQVAVARAALFPTLGAGASADRSRRGGQTASSFAVTLDAGWEIDLWGRVRRTIEATDAGAQASAADLEAVRLLLQAELATNYFQLRVVDGSRELLEDAVNAYARSLQLTQNRYNAGVVSKADVVQAESQLRSTQAQEIDTRATRATLEHAIAVLIGKPPAAVRIEPVPFAVAIPNIPPGIPSTLLERRPDIAAAERRVAAANARIGVAQAAYFPSLSLDGRFGFASGSFSHLFTLPNRTWSLGAALAGTILDFGARAGQVTVAEANYDEAVANYRQAVLTGFQEVENNLATLHWLAEESNVQVEATRAARESVVLTTNQYKAGTVSFLNVVIVQTAQLNEERSMVNIVGRRLAATVALIRAIGGNWEHP